MLGAIDQSDEVEQWQLIYCKKAPLKGRKWLILLGVILLHFTTDLVIVIFMQYFMIYKNDHNQL